MSTPWPWVRPYNGKNTNASSTFRTTISVPLISQYNNIRASIIHPISESTYFQTRQNEKKNSSKINKSQRTFAIISQIPHQPTRSFLFICFSFYCNLLGYSATPDPQSICYCARERRKKAHDDNEQRTNRFTNTQIYISTKVPLLHYFCE